MPFFHALSIGRNGQLFNAPSAAPSTNGCGMILSGADFIWTDSPVATQDYVDEAIAEIDLSPYATTAYVDDAISEVDLSPYATVSYVDSGLGAKANDNTVVKLTGTQTVAGAKTFTSMLQAAKVLVGTSTDDGQGVLQVDGLFTLPDAAAIRARSTNGNIALGNLVSTGLQIWGHAVRVNSGDLRFGNAEDAQLKRVTAGVIGAYQADGTTLGTVQANTITNPSGTLSLTSTGTNSISIVSGNGSINVLTGNTVGSFSAGNSGGTVFGVGDSNSGFGNLFWVANNQKSLVFSPSATAPILTLGRYDRSGANSGDPTGSTVAMLRATPSYGTNVTGGQLVIAGGTGTGSGVGGSIKLQVAPAGSSGSSLNALQDALVIDSTKSATFSGAVGIGTTPGIGDYDAKLHIQGNGSGTTGRTAFVVRNTNANSAAAFILMNNAGKSVTVQASGSSFIGGESAGVGTVGGLSLSFGTDGGATNTGTSPIIFSVGGWQSTQETMRIVPRGSAGSGRVLIGTTTDDGASRLQVAGAATFSGLLSCGVYTVATLPSPSANSGKEAQVTDSAVASSGNFGATVAGGGAHRVKVFSDGTNWVIN